MTQTIVIPNPPQSKDEAIACFTALGQALKLAVQTTELNPSWYNGADRLMKRAHADLDRGGYALEDLLGVPDGTFGAGGSNKGGGGGG